MRSSDPYFDPMRQCEAPGGCQEPFRLRLYPVTDPEGKRTHHWFCKLHAPDRAIEAAS